MAFAYITLQAGYALFLAEQSPNGIIESTAPRAVTFGKVHQLASGSSLVIGDHYCFSGIDIAVLVISELTYYLIKEDKIRFKETPPL